MNSSSENIYRLERIGGEAEYLVYSDGEEIVDAYFISRAPVRGFERLVRGKNPLFVVEAVMRICGLCHTAHGIAAIEALEDALGVSPPANGRLLREALGLLNRVQSHLIHLVFITPDLVPEDSVRDMVIKVINLLNKVNDVFTRIGGAPTHPPNLVIGGFSKCPSEKTLNNQLVALEKILNEYKLLLETIIEKSSESEKIDVLREKTVRVKPLATHLFYGDKYNIDLGKTSVIDYHSYRSGELPRRALETTSLVALYGGESVEVGPRARLMVYREFRDYSLWGIQYARLLEIELAIRRAIELLEQIDPSEPVRSGAIVFKRGRGVGVYEAPRGTLIHTVELDSEGRVFKYRIIVPTMFNIPNMESCARGLPISLADLIPRLYDPCIPCTTHIVWVKK